MVRTRGKHLTINREMRETILGILGELWELYPEYSATRIEAAFTTAIGSVLIGEDLVDQVRYALTGALPGEDGM